MKALTLLAATAIIATTTAASAYDYRQAQIDARRAEQANRIAIARRAGQLTLTEKWRLNGEQRRIAGMERRALADGYISPREAYEINQAQNRAARHIYQESHDRQVAWWKRF
jgi:hypothetical protein